MSTETSVARVERCRKEVDAHPESAVAHFNLALAYTMRGQLGPAEEAYRKTLELDPDRVEAWVNLGGIHLMKWDFRASLEANREALKRKEDLVLAHYNMGQAHLYLAEPEGVVRCNRKVIELDPRHAAGHYFLAVGLLAIEKVDEAREQLAVAMDLGHRPAPEFLRGLERAEKNRLEEQSQSVDNPGAGSPDQDKNAKED
jgi:tetratricopeptide (TPR) repeat protein